MHMAYEKADNEQISISSKMEAALINYLIACKSSNKNEYQTLQMEHQRLKKQKTRFLLAA